MKELIFNVAILVSILVSSSLSCVPCEQETCGETPTCCDSGYLTMGPCGCCPMCAMAEGESCGGSYYDEYAGEFYGSPGLECARGMRCLVKCEGQTCPYRTNPGICLQEAEAEKALQQMQQNNETGILYGGDGSSQTQVAICGDAQPNQAMLCLVVKIILIRIKIFI